VGTAVVEHALVQRFENRRQVAPGSDGVEAELREAIRGLLDQHHAVACDAVTQ
jgi:hypothetical protein